LTYNLFAKEELMRDNELQTHNLKINIGWDMRYNNALPRLGNPRFNAKSYAYLSSKATTPGSSLPSNNSKEAPPPVEM
jgi:hypothetical protein